ncbi:uncharacterized protein LOC131893524 isoform X2 [Tigriopus californicus]|uniref:uncharacterized protein LOC131893524 isoform X2 n=1 Tax=Tigriopus californicus TaxID=6832 RepID=UPI0027DA21E0|nr:uncharacterized protein LOC131893524 isoform X2 [Tigriopus californicus]
MLIHRFCKCKYRIALCLGMIHFFGFGQPSCLQGDIAYERIPGYRLDGFVEAEVFSSGSAELCAELCSGRRQETLGLDYSSIPRNLSLSCGFFNFKIGIENPPSYTSFSVASQRGSKSQCYFPMKVDLTKEVMLREQSGFDTFNQICLQGTREFIEKHCPTIVNIFTRVPGRKPLQSSLTRIHVSSREECIETCLLTTAFHCSSASFNKRNLICHLNDDSNVSQYILEEDIDYLENNCIPKRGSSSEKAGSNYYNDYPGAYRLPQKSPLFSKKAKRQELEGLSQLMSRKCMNQTFHQVRPN